MMSAKRGMGPAGRAPRRTHAVGTASSNQAAPRPAFDLLGATGPSLDAGRVRK